MIHELILHTTTTSQAFRALGLATWALLLVPVTALAESDSGVDRDDDGGVDMPQPDAGSGDGGMSEMDAGSDAGMGSRDGGTDPGVACSCHTDSEAERGQRIHVCTESDDVDVCRDFTCERGTVRSRGCPGDDVQLCCEMGARGLQSYLYGDCTHANCESGFREQCREFGGTVTSGACEGLDGSGGLGGAEDGDDDGGFCAVSTPGSHGGGHGAPLVLGALALIGVRLRRRPAAAGRSPRPAAPRPA
jgi:MYXO-CTERM domain-containing protein